MVRLSGPVDRWSDGPTDSDRERADLAVPVSLLFYPVQVVSSWDKMVVTSADVTVWWEG